MFTSIRIPCLADPLPSRFLQGWSAVSIHGGKMQVCMCARVCVRVHVRVCMFVFVSVSLCVSVCVSGEVVGLGAGKGY